MGLLLDTHVFIWWLRGAEELSAALRQQIEASPQETFVSAVSIWEIAIKASLGKLPVLAMGPAQLAHAIADSGFVELPVAAAHAAATMRLPQLHGDPFDRLLVAQAQAEGLQLATADTAIAQYNVAVVPAR